MLLHHIALGFVLASSLLGCATEEGYTPISDDREDQTSTLALGEEATLVGDCKFEECDMQFTLSVSGVAEETGMGFVVSLLGEQDEDYFTSVLFNRSGEPVPYHYDPVSQTSTWQVPILNSRIQIPQGRVFATVKFAIEDFEATRVQATLAWESGPPAVLDSAEGSDCALSTCPGDLECIKSSEDWVCVARCFMDAQCRDQCSPPPEGSKGWDIDGIRGICTEG